MKIFTKIILGLALISNLNSSIYAIEKPGKSNIKDRKLLQKALNGYRNQQFFNARSDEEIQRIEYLSYDALEDKNEIEYFGNTLKNVSSEVRKNKNFVKQILNELINKSTQELEKRNRKVLQKKYPVLKPSEKSNPAQNKAQAPMQKIEPVQKEPHAPQQMLPQLIKNKLILEQHEEEIRPNRLYIGLDIKPLNTKGQPILWQEPIDMMISKIKDAEFVPNDYFHITIAWYETKNPVSLEFIAQIERALAHASQILKIVFPFGVIVTGLLDGAILLGNKKDSVVFRIAESDELKKLQQILLQFISFENIEGFKFSTFEREYPLHVTLGKIRPSKSGIKFQNIAANLNAPEGSRASLGQSFNINTFRLTYSSAGQAWQEKMSYKF
jgi:hypothetical protein